MQGDAAAPRCPSSHFIPLTPPSLSFPAPILQTFRGAVNNFEQHLLRPAWSPEGTVGGRVSVGSSDKAVRVWDYETGEVVTALGGHKGAALGVAFHPKEAILASCGADKTVFLSEYLNA